MKIKEVIPTYLNYLTTLGRSAYSIRVTKYNLRDLVRFLQTEKVYTIERLAQLCESAQAVLGGAGISNVEFYAGDGSRGWPKKRWDPALACSVELEPCFDRIIITAAANHIPP